MTMLRHTEVQQLLGAHSLHALEPDEAEAVDLHVESCARCRDELQLYVESAAALATDDVEPPPELWAKIESRLASPGAARGELATVTPMRPGAWRARGRQMLAAAAVVVALLAAGVAVERRRDEPGTSLAAAVADVARNPETRRVALRGADGSARAEVLLLRGQGWVAEDSLPQLPDDETYQLWGLRGDATVSLGVLGSDPEIASFVAGDDFDTLAITAEKKPGVTAPTGSIQASGTVAAT